MTGKGKGQTKYLFNSVHRKCSETVPRIGMITRGTSELRKIDSVNRWDQLPLEGSV